MSSLSLKLTTPIRVSRKELHYGSFCLQSIHQLLAFLNFLIDYFNCYLINMLVQLQLGDGVDSIRRLKTYVANVYLKPTAYLYAVLSQDLNWISVETWLSKSGKYSNRCHSEISSSCSYRKYCCIWEEIVSVIG